MGARRQVLANFCRCLEIEELIDDPRFDSLDKRYENNSELIKILDDRFAERTRDEWAERLEAEGCMWAPVQSLDEVIADPQPRPTATSWT